MEKLTKAQERVEKFLDKAKLNDSYINYINKNHISKYNYKVTCMLHTFFVSLYKVYNNT